MCIVEITSRAGLAGCVDVSSGVDLVSENEGRAGKLGTRRARREAPARPVAAGALALRSVGPAAVSRASRCSSGTVRHGIW